MKTIDYIDENVPTWALSYLVNGDASGLEEGEQEMIDKWWEDCAKALPSDCHLQFHSDDSEFFTWSPAFGLAATCVSAVLMAWASNDDPRDEIELPEWTRGEED